MNQNPFEQLLAERTPDSTLISEIDVIQEGGITPRTKEDLSRLVEPPLLEACEELYDKNIETVMSSANSKDVEIGYGYIDVDFDLLSSENQQIALTFGEPFLMHGPEPRSQCVKLEFPINVNTTVGDIRKIAHNAVSRFETQERIARELPIVEPYVDEIKERLPEFKQMLLEWTEELEFLEKNPESDPERLAKLRVDVPDLAEEIRIREIE